MRRRHYFLGGARRAGLMAALVIMVLAQVGDRLPPTAVAGDLRSRQLVNPAAHIPSQCYTKTQDAGGKAHNPCFICHVRAREPNYISDAALQLEYALPGPAEKNHWTNLFKDRRAHIDAVSDDDIRRYIRTSNYFAADGALKLPQRLHEFARSADSDGDGAWSGFVPDCHFRFDEEGFDVDASGQATGWRAFAYVPLPGGFWPANGSTDDVLIRLADEFRRDAAGVPSRLVYKINLAIVEALIRRRDVEIAPQDERSLGVDLDRDGVFGIARKVAFDWDPSRGRNISFVGAAGEAQRRGRVHLAAGLYPEGTEFLHTVRYIDFDETTGSVRMAARMKEVRYAIKTRWLSYADLEEAALAEVKEKDDFPDRLPQYIGDVEYGIGNGQGWRLQGFIEDGEGELRPQTYEETVFCMGCHGGLGITDDSSFAFPRKLDAATAHAGGWYHWTQKGIEGTPEPLRADGRRELLAYLQENGAGDEFRGNTEIRERFFDASGDVKPSAAEGLRNDISLLLFPSFERGMKLNKAYREIVREQSYILGRDPVVAPSSNVHQEVRSGLPTGVESPVRAAGW